MAEDFIQSPPDSTGKRVHSKMVNDGVADIYTPVMMLADRDIPSQRQGVDNKGAAFVRFADGSAEFDVFGRTTVSEPNLGGLKAYEKSGFIIEGRLREASFRDNEFHDKLTMSILKSEWEGR